jgi:uncharacterized glyoxalase superfamily protein PhnB
MAKAKKKSRPAKRPPKAKAKKAKAGKAKRSVPESFRAKSVSVSLTVNDLTRSAAWYVGALGFHKGKEYAWNGKLGAIQLLAGSIEILVNQDDGAKGFDRVKGDGLSIQFTTTQDIDAIAARAKAFGATLTVEPQTAPWGDRFFRITDPDGFKLVFNKRS